MNNPKLFVYGQLKPGSKYQPHSFGHIIPATINAKMYRLKGDPAIKQVGNTKHKAEGYLLNISPEDFKKLDKIEAPQYKRTLVTTPKGKQIYVYEYKDSIINRKVIKNWPIPWKMYHD